MTASNQCDQCFYVFEGPSDLLAHKCPAADEPVETVAFRESEDPAAIGPLEGAFVDNFISGFVNAAEAGHVTAMKARVNGAPEGGDGTYALGVLIDGDFRPMLLMWTSAFSDVVVPLDPDIKVSNPTETQEMDGSTQD